VTKEQALKECLVYMREHLGCWQDASDADLGAWLRWHWDMGLVAPMLNAAGKLAALLVVRYINRPELYPKTYTHQKDGKICVAELLIVTEPPALEAAVLALVRRWGKPFFLMHERYKWGERCGPKTLLWTNFERHLRRMYAQPQSS
jgi:hypothetical protein